MNRQTVGALALALAAVPGAALAELTVCNDGASRLSVAIGYKDGQWTSEGWWTVEAGACSIVIGGDLPKRYYYYRVSGEDTGFTGEGFYFCTSPEVFTIAGDTDCEARGYRREAFSELDVGEATSWTLRLDYGRTTRNRLIAPRAGIEPGTYGEPFSVQAVFDECVLEGDYSYCGFSAEGWRWTVPDDGRTPAAILDALAQLPPATPISVAGDVVSYGDITVEAVARAVEQREPTANERLLMRMQGRWQSTEDPSSLIEIFGTTQTDFYDGAWMSEALLDIADTCPESQTAGTPHLIATDPETQQSYCYAIDSVGADRLELLYLPGGNFLSYRKVQ